MCLGFGVSSVGGAPVSRGRKAATGRTRRVGGTGACMALAQSNPPPPNSGQGRYLGRSSLNHSGEVPVDRIQLEDSIETMLDHGLVQNALGMALEAQNSGRLRTREFNSILDRLGKCGRHEDATLFFETLPAMHDVASYSIMISMNAKNNMAFEAEQFFNRMVDKGVTPNAFTYSALIQALGRQRRFSDAKAVFRSMHSNGVVPNVVAYNAIIKAYSSSNAIEEAFSVAKEMSEVGRRPDVVTYGTLIDACAKERDVQRAFKVYEEMRACLILPTAVCYVSLIDACGRSNRPNRAFDVMELMKADGVKPYSEVYNAMISVFAKHRMVDEAFQMYEEMRRNAVPPCQVCFICWK
uniref:Pentacotripeptide-repeat region of PRORP domain-containing protein n=1 Tax=Rhodosorus marinus TaxID=101924 RepID=A0A7S3EPU4_9RHOD|mmetsp:Transcript_8390/g.37505  ORF Transcript_8390/g.37505 Transcript_8390/m.37505 type:complete len:353 (+) Transcript_8390:187-1245(+)